MRTHNRVRFDRDYSDAERVLFSEYSGQRAEIQPPECDRGEECWVRFGPPCYRTDSSTMGYCVGCHGEVRAAR